MFLTALCPTFRHPELLANSLALWNAQDYPASMRRLIILDDGGTFATQRSENWEVCSVPSRYPSLPAKYNALLYLANCWGPKTDAYVVWEDDDIYGPSYLSGHAEVLKHHELSKPGTIITDAPGFLQKEPGTGRFHSSLAFRRELIERIGGWIDTKRADFDLQLIAKLHKEAKSFGDPWPDGNTQFFYGWHTGAAHCQWTMSGPSDEEWYAKGEQAYKQVPFVGKLEPKYDERTKRVLERLGTPWKL